MQANPSSIVCPVGRLAPSPTGAQHVGNARTYLLAWLALRSRGGRIILRLEDIDSPRIKQNAAEMALADLTWLGLDWDEGPDVGGPHAPYVQTQRLARYRTALEQLQAQELVYPCTCTRTDVERAASAPHLGQEGPIYPGTCARRSVADAADLAGRPFSWRFRASAPVREFHDAIAGRQRASVAKDLGDFVVAKADGTPAYQLAVVVDDAAMGVTEVLRGDDLLPSAFRQLDLYAALKSPPPTFAHAPLVVGPDGKRLAKRHGDTRISLLRDLGIPAERLIGLLAWSCGLAASRAPLRAQDLLPGFDLARIRRQPFVMSDVLWAELTGL
jgi:glutamyl-tRNA synthetase